MAKKSSAPKRKMTLTRDGKRFKVDSCSTSKTSAKQKQRSIQNKGYRAIIVKRDGKYCVAKGPKRKSVVLSKTGQRISGRK